MNKQTIGTCSRCGGPVTVDTVFHSIVPPVPTCEQCGAQAAEHGPIIKTELPRFGQGNAYTFGQGNTYNTYTSVRADGKPYFPGCDLAERR